MRALSAVDVMNAWEDGSPKALAERALKLLELVCPESSRDKLGSLSIGERDGILLGLREGLFGSSLAAVVVCPGCGERLDLTFDVREIRSSAQQPQGEICLDVAGYDLRLRPINTADAIAASGQADLDQSRELLLQRCLLSARRDGISIESDQIPPDVAELAVQRMAEADPMADLQLAITCPSCEQRWPAALDVVSFLWSEIEAWAWRALSEVHTLASVYGWTEREILSLSPDRRQCYLQMVGA
jgi:hypothetical protein